MDKNTNTTDSGLGLGTVLFLIFLVLKLCNVIDWSWWWVTSPLWISAGLIILLFIGVFIYYSIEDARMNPKPKRGKKNDKN
jgi:hypothetical protein